MTTSAPYQPTDLPVVEDELVFMWRFDQLVFVWRFDQFQRLGFEEEEAGLLAGSDVDLNQARSLVAAGCPLTIAVQILV
jgi:hypothetical protein